MTSSLLILTSIFFLASTISVISGSTSLITVPVMFQFGIEPRTAIATNMLALTFMSLGGTLPFIGQGAIDSKRLPWLIILTLVGSLLGALLIFVLPSQSMPVIISFAMFVMAALSIFNQNKDIDNLAKPPSRLSEIGGYVATFLLGIYGGFFSGGYVTLLTAAYVMLFRMTFLQAIATTKLINIFSSLMATIIFTSQRIVDYKLGCILGITMFMGGIIGAKISLKLSNLWLQRIYLMAIAILAFLTLRKYPIEKSTY